MRTCIVSLSNDQYAAYAGTWMIARGSLEHVLAVRRGDAPKLERIPSHTSYKEVLTINR